MRSQLFLPLLLLLGGCVHDVSHGLDRCLKSVPLQTTQAIVVTGKNTANPYAVDIRLLQKEETAWKSVGFQIQGVIGINGIALPGKKREGDGLTPSGVFPLERAFGYEPFPTKMPYIVVNRDMVWIDDPKSANYNKLVSRSEGEGFSFEEMRRNDDLYKRGIVVEYNTKDVTPGAGSAIFFHHWRGPETSTAGCVATSEADLIRILQWLDPEKKPVTVISPGEECSTTD